jgi:ABC-type Zn uptake system ZnuABC Zn-binding protein ZnuA
VWTGVALVAAAAALSGCAGGGSDGGGAVEPGKLRIATTVAPITSIVSSIGGNRVDVTGIVPEGTNSHTFEPRPSAAAMLSRADLVFVNGLKLEDPTAELALANLKDGGAIVELGGRCIAEKDWIYDFSFPKSDGKPNPHLWTDPRYARCYGRVARDVLSARDPANAAYYARNFASFAAMVGRLDRAMRTAFATIPKRELLTYHDAYAYFAKDYGWKVIGAIQVSDFEEPTPREVGELIEQVRAEKVPAIFGSEVFPSPVLEQIGRETGVRYVDVLRDDDLPGKPGEPEHSWAGLMRFDYVTMTDALGGDAAALRAVSLRGGAPDGAEYPQ